MCMHACVCVCVSMGTQRHCSDSVHLFDFPKQHKRLKQKGSQKAINVTSLHSLIPHVFIGLLQLLVGVFQASKSGITVGQFGAPLPLLVQQLSLEVELQLLAKLVPV